MVVSEVSERVEIGAVASGDEKIQVGDCVLVFLVCCRVNLEYGSLEIAVSL